MIIFIDINPFTIQSRPRRTSNKANSLKKNILRDYIIVLNHLLYFRVWDEYITGLHCGEEADRWIRQYLGNEWASIVMSTESMEKRESCVVYKPSGNPAKEGDIVCIVMSHD